MGSLIQQDLFKKANHRMVILTNFHPSLEEKKNFTEHKNFIAYDLQNAEGQHLQLRNQRNKNVDKDMLWIYWKPKRRFSWPNNEKFQRGGNSNFLSE